MSNIARIMQQAAAGVAAGELLAIEDVFSTYLYTGNGSTQTITNGIDLAGEGGLVWMKNRAPTGYAHSLYDTARGATYELATQSTNPQYLEAQGLTSFNSNGFSLGSRATGNGSGETYASWTFRKAPRFFDVVTYTGNGVAGRTIAHNLGTTVGSIFVKRTDTTSDWTVYHRGLHPSTPESDYIILNSTASFNSATSRWNDTQPTDSVFTLGNSVTVNASGGTYVAYLFAHDPLGPSGDGSDGLIACGSFATSGATDTITLGWEPQFVLWKLADATFDWQMFDSMRGMTVGDDAQLEPNTSDAELTGVNRLNPTATGFTTSTFASGLNVIYIAIRRGPMREPTSGTEVFEPTIYTGNNSYPRTIGSLPVVDLAMPRGRDGAGSPQTIDRMRGGSVYLFTSNTNAESNISPSYEVNFDNQNGLKIASQINSSGTNYVNYSFRRAPGFFDVVAYQGNNVAGRTVPHNLGVAPEMMIVKSRQITNSWFIYHKDLGATYAMNFDTSAAFVNTASWNSTAPTDSVFTLGGTGGGTNAATSTFIAYLFATLPGISKVGSYTGNGSNQTINCGFTGGARFVLIKRTDSTGDWLIGDTARGIVAGNDPYLELNTTAAEDTDEDWLDPDSSGFIVNETSTANANVNNATYIYLAIA